MCIGILRRIWRFRRLCRPGWIWFGKLGRWICRSSYRSRSVRLRDRGCRGGLVGMRGEGRALLRMGFHLRFLLVLGLWMRCWGMRCRWRYLSGGRCLPRRVKLVRGGTCRRVFLRRHRVWYYCLCIDRGSSALHLLVLRAMG